VANSAKQTDRPLLLPDVGDIIFLLILQLLLFSLPNFVFTDGSTGWHIVTGRYIVEKLTIPVTDIFSYTFPNAPWVSYEWLADMIMYLPVQIADLNGLAVAVSSAIALLFLLLYKRCRRTGCHFVVAVILTMFGALASSVSWLARPHIFTFFAVFAFAGLLESHRRGNTSGARLTALLAAIVALWANLHPAFLVGFAMIGIYLLSDLACLAVLVQSDDANNRKRRIRWLGLALVAGFAATIINPYGPRLWSYILQYLKGVRVLAHTDEYSSPIFHGAIQSTALEVVLCMFVLGLVVSRRRPSLPQLSISLLFAGMALASVRHIPLFVIVTLPVIAELFANASLLSAREQGQMEPAQWWQKLQASWNEMGETVDEMESLCRLHLLPIGAVLILAIAGINGGKLLGIPLLESGFDPERFPTRTLECIREHHLKPETGFNMDNWGGYISYKLGIPVFIDDRADFYGESFYLDYGTVSTVSPGWRDVLDKYKIEWVLFPANSRLASSLSEEPDWKLLCEDKASLLLVRAAEHSLPGI